MHDIALMKIFYAILKNCSSFFYKYMTEEFFFGTFFRFSYKIAWKIFLKKMSGNFIELYKNAENIFIRMTVKIRLSIFWILNFLNSVFLNVTFFNLIYKYYKFSSKYSLPFNCLQRRCKTESVFYLIIFLK